MQVWQTQTLANGARQFVVQLALDTMLRSDVYDFSLTPTTNMGASLLGAEMMTFFAPPCYQKFNGYFANKEEMHAEENLD